MSSFARADCLLFGQCSSLPCFLQLCRGERGSWTNLFNYSSIRLIYNWSILRQTILQYFFITIYTNILFRIIPTAGDIFSTDGVGGVLLERRRRRISRGSFLSVFNHKKNYLSDNLNSFCVCMNIFNHIIDTFCCCWMPFFYFL